jgi:ribosomal protein S24E
MDEYPEIGAAFDIYADECTQRGSKNERWTIHTNNDLAHSEVERFFKTIDLKTVLWDISRNTIKYGDNFLEAIVDVNRPKLGIRKIKILNPNYMIRSEDAFGYLKKFMQEVPNENALAYGAGAAQKPQKYIDLDKNQIIHFRLHTSNPMFYPYGKSIAAGSHRIYRSLKMMEDAMMIYRLTRAPERRIFYVDTGNLPTSKAEMFMERLKQKFKKEKFYNSQKGTVDSRFNPMSMDEDYFVPTRNGIGTKIETLPGASNLDQIEDVKYYRDKLMASLKIPKDYIVEKDKSPERKANLSQLDVKFSRTIQRVQQSVEKGLESLAKRHLTLRGYPSSIVRELEINLPEPSDVSIKRKLELDDMKLRVIQAAQGLGLLSQDAIYKEYFDYKEDEIKRMKYDIKKEKEEQQKFDQASAAAAGSTGGAGNVAPTGPPISEEIQVEIKEEEPVLTNLERLILKNGASEEESTIFSRILEKQQRKVEPFTD